jgi:hypothetical protein
MTAAGAQVVPGMGRHDNPFDVAFQGDGVRTRHLAEIRNVLYHAF